jgi:hypothetical protein
MQLLKWHEPCKVGVAVLVDATGQLAGHNTGPMDYWQFD